MIIRFGYVAMSAILKDCSPSKTITLNSLMKLNNEKARFSRLTAIAKLNIANTQRLLYHNQGHDIKVFRLTSKLIPLATHPIAENWDWGSDLERELKKLGEYILKNNFRISAHPDHFTLINSPDNKVITSSLKDLEYHHKIFEIMGLDNSAKLVIHIGGAYNNKEEAIKRFIKNYELLPQYLKNRIILENDDKIYTIHDVLKICDEVGAPMVLDLHHHWCTNTDEDIFPYLSAIFSTWNKEKTNPKIHLSSPKSEKDFRSHADFIELESFLSFLENAKQLDRNFDVMIEAKQKDAALFKLMEDIKKKTSYKFLDQATIEI